MENFYFICISGIKIDLLTVSLYFNSYSGNAASLERKKSRGKNKSC